MHNKPSYRTASGNDAAVDITREVVLDEILRQYSDYRRLRLDQIWNMDESSLVYQFIGKQTIALEGMEVHGTHDHKDTVTIIALISASGQKVPLIFINKSIVPTWTCTIIKICGGGHLRIWGNGQLVNLGSTNCKDFISTRLLNPIQKMPGLMDI